MSFLLLLLGVTCPFSIVWFLKLVPVPLPCFLLFEGEEAGHVLSIILFINNYRLLFEGEQTGPILIVFRFKESQFAFKI